jgi:hypothetical protein
MRCARSRDRAPSGYSERPRLQFAGLRRSSTLATPNYSYEKRQRELAKKRKNEEKRQRKLTGKSDTPDLDTPADGLPGEPASPDTPAPEGQA